MKYFVTAIGTDSGKTLVSAIITEMLQCDYWKPIQSGEPRDTLTVKSLLSNTTSNLYQEQYFLQTPASPHASAKIDGVEIQLEAITTPISNTGLVIEGAGGLLVPLNDTDTMLDLIKYLEVEVVLVANLYLGSINHTLLTVDVLKRHDVPVKGIIFNGESNPASQDIILQKSGWPELLHILPEEQINPSIVTKYADMLKKTWK